MSVIFTPKALKGLNINNRFVHSATYESMASESGEVTSALIKRYNNLAKGKIGLIIPGYMYVEPLGQAYKYQTGICEDSMIDGLKKLTHAVHQEKSKIIFQIAHAGQQTSKDVIGQSPLGASSKRIDPINFSKPRKMQEDEIYRIIKAFQEAAVRCVKAGADGIQLHAAHGYLINQFISPFFNNRKDDWGGSDENRFRFFKEIIIKVKSVLPLGMPLLVKLNTNDYTPFDGISLSLSVKYARWLKDLGIDGLEVSCGTASYSFMNICRGDVPVQDFVKSMPWWKKPLFKFVLSIMQGKYNLKQGYNLEAAKLIKPVIGDIPLLLVGGIRKVDFMNQVLEKGDADFISMSRPYIREPFLVKQISSGKTHEVSCVSCNRCAGAVANDLPVRCYFHGK